MSRIENIYYGIVNSENSMTELLCNYMAYKPFRDLFLSLFLTKEELGNFQYSDFQTQYTVELNNCRPDLAVTNDRYEILIEIKTSNSGLTENQPTSYLQHLYESRKEDSYLIFLIPSNYAYQNYWLSKVNNFVKYNEPSNIVTKIIYWNDLIDVIQQSALFEISEKVNDFYNLLKTWFEVKKVTFTSAEVACMFKPEIPNVLNKLFGIVNEVKSFCEKSFKGKIISDDVEYSVYFVDEDKNYFFFFGIWYEFWNEYGIPLCYGMSSDWDEKKLSSFKSNRGTLIEKNDYLMSPIPEDILVKQNCSEEIAQLIYDELSALTK